MPTSPLLAAALVAASPEAVLVADAAGRYVDANPAAETLLGYPRQDLLGLTVADVVADRDGGAAAFAGLKAAGRWTGELELRRRDGSLAPVDVVAVAVPAPTPGTGGPLYAAFLRDITARRAREAALRAAEALYRSLVEQVPAVVYSVPAEGGVELSYISPRVVDLLGFTPEEVLARPSLFHEEVHPDDRQPAEATEAATDASGEPFAAEYRVPHKDGGWVWVRDEAVLVRDAQGRRLQWQGLLSDAGAQKAAEAALVAARDAAEAADRSKTAFLRMVSHELRTPLTAVLGYAHLLLGGADGPLSERQVADLGRVVAGAERLLALVNDVLDLARIEAGALELEPRPVDLATLAADAAADLSPLAAAKGIGLVVEAEPGVAARLDPLRMRQVLLNLLGNAVKFTDAGTVTIVVGRAGATAEIAVRDTGCGIAPAALPHVFDEFRQADASTTRRHGGSGLGLAIAKKLVELHGGRISVASEPGVGSTFTVVLPTIEA